MPHHAKPDYWENAVEALMERDRILRRVIPEHRELHLASQGQPFVTLLRAVVGQQISTKAADAVWRRLEGVCGGLPTPVGILGFEPEALRGAGLSRRKVEYVVDIARHFHDGLVHPEQWASMEDEIIVRELTAIRGIGRWTAEMFLIFNLRRPDILPLDDVGLLKAISVHYFSGEPVSRFEAREVAQAWKPWSTVATWYLWRSLDAVAVEY